MAVFSMWKLTFPGLGCVCVCVLATQSYLTLCELKVDFQVSLSMEFSRQEY